MSLDVNIKGPEGEKFRDPGLKSCLSDVSTTQAPSICGLSLYIFSDDISFIAEKSHEKMLNDMQKQKQKLAHYCYRRVKVTLEISYSLFQQSTSDPL